MNISAIITAAGLSTRMGEVNKLLVDFRGKPLLHHIVDELLETNVAEILVVTGFEKEKIEKSLHDKKVKSCFNENFKSGLTSSIQTGLKASSPNSDGYLIALSDMPFIKTKMIDKLLHTFHENKKVQDLKQIVVPQINKRNSHPTIFSNHYKKDILAHQNPNGCKQIILDNLDRVFFVKLENEMAGIDIDDLPTLNKFRKDNTNERD